MQITNQVLAWKLNRLSGFEKLKAAILIYAQDHPNREYMETPGDMAELHDILCNELTNIKKDWNECGLKFLEDLYQMTMTASGLMSYKQFNDLMKANFQEFMDESPNLTTTMQIWAWG